MGYQKSRWMSEKSLGKPSYSKHEKRAVRVMKRIKRHESGKWVWRYHIPLDAWISYRESRPVNNESEGTTYPGCSGYVSLPRIIVSWYWKNSLYRLVIQLPNKRAMNSNLQRKAVGTEHYTSRKGDGSLWGGQRVEADHVERPCIWASWRDQSWRVMRQREWWARI